jgi:hypothetical protein
VGVEWDRIQIESRKFDLSRLAMGDHAICAQCYNRMALLLEIFCQLAIQSQTSPAKVLPGKSFYFFPDKKRTGF